MAWAAADEYFSEVAAIRSAVCFSPAAGRHPEICGEMASVVLGRLVNNLVQPMVLISKTVILLFHEPNI